MSLYKAQLNPFTGALQLVYDGTIATFKAGVNTYTSLPVTGNAKGDARITNDTGHCYVWSLTESSGALTDWTDLGDIVDITWDSIEGKPSSAVNNIDDAVTKRHTQNTDQKVDEGGANETSVSDIRDAADKKHVQGTDTTLGQMAANVNMNSHKLIGLSVPSSNGDSIRATAKITESNLEDAVDKKHETNKDTILDDTGTDEVSANELRMTIFNQIVVFIRTAVENALSIFEIINGYIDVYTDQSGIDTGSSEYQTYNSVDDYYTPVSGYDEYTKLMLHLNGVDGATATTDVSDSAHTIGFSGQAQLDTDQKKFGSSSLIVDGDGDYITASGTRSDWQFGSGDFTIDFQFRLSGALSSNYLMSCLTGGTYWQLLYTSSAFQIASNSLSQAVISGSAPLNTGQWYHVEVSRESGTFRFFLDGIELTLQQSATGSMANPDADLDIGGVGGANDFPGWMDEIRISKGVARHTANFTAPTSEYSGENENMTLVSDTLSLDSAFDRVRIVCIEEDIDAITYNTDLLLYVSRNDGVTWTQATLQEVAVFGGNEKILISTVDISGQASDTDFRYKYITANEKLLKIHATGLLGVS